MSTLPQTQADAQAPVSAAAPLVLETMSDEDVVEFVAMVQNERRRENDHLGAYERAGLAELERRIRERRKTSPDARAIAHPLFEIEMVEEFTPYRADVAALRACVPLLPADEAAKVLVHVPERIEVLAAHDAAGNVASIKALAKKYAGSQVGDLLALAIVRDRTGEKLSFKPRKGVA